MALKIVHLAVADTDKTKPERKLTKRQIFHNMAVEGLARQKILDKKRAEKKFAPERAELEELKRHLAELKQQLSK